MEWFCAYDFVSESGTVANPNGEQSPDGLAENLLTRDGANLGPSWVGFDGDEMIECDITTSSVDPSACVFFLVCDASDAATITLRRGTIAVPGSLVTTLTKCSPAHLWIGFSDVTTNTDQWTLQIDDTGAGTPSNPATLSAQFFGIGTRIVLGGAGHGLSVSRPSQSRALVDLSTHATGQLGADFANEQPSQFTLALEVGSHEDTDKWALLRAAWLSCKTVRPVLMCADKDRATEYGVTVLGRFVAMPVESVSPGMVVSSSVTVVEML